MKPQNFYDFLEEYSFCGDSILKQCKEIKEIEEWLVKYFEDGEKTPRRLYANMKVLGAKTQEDLEEKKEEEIAKRKQIIQNISKFIIFLEKEGETHLEIIQSDKFCKWLDSEESEQENYFETIDSLPIYIQKKSGVLVRDLLETFEQIMFLVASSIEEVLGVSFPIDGRMRHIDKVQIVVRKNGIRLTRNQAASLSDLVLTYEDFEDLSEIIKEDIKELEEPIKR